MRRCMIISMNKHINELAGGYARLRYAPLGMTTRRKVEWGDTLDCAMLRLV